MTISIQRLTLFAIFDSLEKDLRSFLLSEILPYHVMDSVLNTNELSKITERYKKSNTSQTDDLSDSNDLDYLERLVPYLDLLDTVQIINRHKGKILPDLAKYFSEITSTLERCVPVRNAVMHGRPLEIDDFPTVCEIARKLTVDAEYDWRNLSETLSEIENDSSYVFGLNFTITDESPSGAFHNLPTPEFDDTGFVGRQTVLTKVKDAISGPFPVISIIGPGGVGKTALAIKVAYELITNKDFELDAIVWVSAKAKTLTAKEIERIEGAIQDSIGVFRSIVSEFEPNSQNEPEYGVIELLATFRVLLVLDNLETVLDGTLARIHKEGA